MKKTVIRNFFEGKLEVPRIIQSFQYLTIDEEYIHTIIFFFLFYLYA